MYGADNGALGGLITQIGIENGKLGRIALIHDGRVEYIRTHPDTGKRVYGVEIPHFEKIASAILKMCCELNFVPYIAWDIVVTKHSFKILELNSNTDMYGYQLFGPLLSDIRLLKFYKQFLTKRREKFFMR